MYLSTSFGQNPSTFNVAISLFLSLILMFDKLYNKSEESFYKILYKNLKENKKTFIVTANPET